MFKVKMIATAAAIVAALPMAGDAYCQQNADELMLQMRKEAQDTRMVINPVTGFDCPDPSVVEIDGWFYCFKTGYPIGIYRSRDLCNWEFYRNMFEGPSAYDPYGDGKLDPMKTGAKAPQRINYWAPSPAVIDGKIVVYLTLFVSMENDRQVVCVADDIASPFRYVNTLNVGTPEHPTPQDGQYFKDDDGHHYLVYGDVNSKGNFIRELAPDGVTYAKGSKPFYVTKAYEGGNIYKYKGLYYFFCSKNYYYTQKRCTFAQRPACFALCGEGGIIPLIFHSFEQ